VRRKAEYLRFAEDCRELARTMGRQDQREALLKMAETWEQLAQAHEPAERTVSERDMTESRKPEKK
jgi:hypothetical protein